MRNDAMERPEYPLMYLEFGDEMENEFGSVYSIRQLYDPSASQSDASSFTRLDSNASSNDGYASNLNIARASSHEVVCTNSLSDLLSDGGQQQHNQLISSISLDSSSRDRHSVARSKSVEMHRPRSPRTSLVAMHRVESYGSYDDGSGIGVPHGGDATKLSPHPHAQSQGTTHSPKTTPPGSPKLGYVTQYMSNGSNPGAGAASTSGTHRLLIIPNKPSGSCSPSAGGCSSGPVTAGMVSYMTEEQRSRFNQRRIGRHEKRYHTADAIQEIRKDMDKDSAIHKRLSWNLGTVDINISDDKQCAGVGGAGVGAGGTSLKSKTFSVDSLRSMPSSSGVSSTGSLHLSREDSYGEDTQPQTQTTTGTPSGGHMHIGAKQSHSQPTQSTSNVPISGTMTMTLSNASTNSLSPAHTPGPARGVLIPRPNTPPPPIVTTTPPIEHSNSLDPSSALNNKNKYHRHSTNSDILLNVGSRHVSKSMPDIAAVSMTLIPAPGSDVKVDDVSDGVVSGGGATHASRKLNHSQLVQMRKQLLLNSTLEAS